MPAKLNAAALESIEQGMATGLTREQLILVCEAQWQMSDRTVRRYMKIVRDRWQEQGLKTQADRMFNQIAREALAKGKYGAAVQATERLRQAQLLHEHGNAAYSGLGDVPADPLAGVAWAQRALLMSMRDATQDPTLTPQQRRRELVAISKSITALVPDSRRFEAEEIIKKDAGAMESSRPGGLEPKNVADRRQGSLRIEDPRSGG